LHRHLLVAVIQTNAVKPLQLTLICSQETKTIENQKTQHEKFKSG